MEYWQKELETMPRGELEELQLSRLKQTFELAKNAPFYAKRFTETGISEIRSLDDLKRLPFTTKDDLRANYPFGLAAIPLQKCVR
ncbi:MAG: phenylacetate--CoA ligase, partial [Dysgonamonadaceae bacterium]|nr:phenylacetate--CoA ligase [Dysgonamonadaceae bacterium]